jgi:hypothetical protein
MGNELYEDPAPARNERPFVIVSLVCLCLSSIFAGWVGDWRAGFAVFFGLCSILMYILFATNVTDSRIMSYLKRSGIKPID